MGKIFTLSWNASSGRGNRKFGQKIEKDGKTYLREDGTGKLFPVFPDTRIESIDDYNKRIKKTEKDLSDYKKRNIERREYLRSLR